MRGEKIYEYDLDITGMTDYGAPLDAILSGQVQVPPQGVRIDVAFVGRGTGRLQGQVRGVDYTRMRADGRVDLDIRATIETEAGQRIALSADGVAVPRADEPIADLSENVTLSSSGAWARSISRPGRSTSTGTCSSGPAGGTPREARCDPHSSSPMPR